MASLNKVMLIGNLTRDAELRYIPSGSAVLSFRLAVSRKFKKQDGTDGEETCFVDVSLWGKRGEAVSKYLTKGKPLFVEGRLQLDEWDDKATGQKRSKLCVNAENIEFLGGRNDGQGGGGRTEGDAYASGDGASAQGGGASQGGAPSQGGGAPRPSYNNGSSNGSSSGSYGASYSGAPRGVAAGAAPGNGSHPYPAPGGTGAAMGVTEDDIPF